MAQIAIVCGTYLVWPDVEDQEITLSELRAALATVQVPAQLPSDTMLFVINRPPQEARLDGNGTPRGFDLDAELVDGRFKVLTSYMEGIPYGTVI